MATGTLTKTAKNSELTQDPISSQLLPNLKNKKSQQERAAGLSKGQRLNEQILCSSLAFPNNKPHCTPCWFPTQGQLMHEAFKFSTRRCGPHFRPQLTGPIYHNEGCNDAPLVLMPPSSLGHRMVQQCFSNLQESPGHLVNMHSDSMGGKEGLKCYRRLLLAQGPHFEAELGGPSKSTSSVLSNCDPGKF